MATSSYDSIFGLTAGFFAVPVGLTNAILVDGSQVKACNSTQLKFSSGGTCLVVGVPGGATLTQAQLASASGYLLSANEVLSLAGPARFYLANTGATSIVYFIQGMSEGY